jgi:hypothetical protein
MEDKYQANNYIYKIELENFSDSKGIFECDLEYAIGNLKYAGMIYATTEWMNDHKFIICKVAIDRNEIMDKSLEEIKSILDAKVNARRFPHNRPLEQLGIRNKQ